MAINMNFNTLQINKIKPHLEGTIAVASQQRTAEQNISRIDKKIAFIDKEIELTEKYIVNNNKIIKVIQESKKIIQEEMDMVISILQHRGVTVIKQNGVWVEGTNSLKAEINNSERDIVIRKKVEMAKQKIIDSDKKIEAVDKYSQKLDVQPIVKKDVIVSTYKPTSVQLGSVVRNNHVFNQTILEEINTKQKYSLPVIYQSQKNIYESILNNLLLKVVV